MPNIICKYYLYQEICDNSLWLVEIDNSNMKYNDNIDHVLENVYFKLNTNWKLIAWGNDLGVHGEYSLISFVSFILATELVINRQRQPSGGFAGVAYGYNDYSFNELFYEIEDGLLQQIINKLHVEFIMEELSGAELSAYNYIIKHGPKSSRKNLIFKSKEKKKKKEKETT